MSKIKKYIFREEIVGDYTYDRDITKWKTIESSQDSDGKNFESIIGVGSRYVGSRSSFTICSITNDNFEGKGCWETKSDYERLLEKSIFKDKINAILPND